jgi:hypothetical protein
MLRILELYGWSEGWKILVFLVGVSDITNNLPEAYSKVALGQYVITLGNNNQGYSAYALSGGSTDFLLISETIVEPLIIAPTLTPFKNYVEKLTMWFLSDEGQKTFLEYSDYIPVKKINSTNWKINLLSRVEEFLDNTVLDYYVSNDILEHSDLIKVYYTELMFENTTYQYLKQVFSYLIKKNDSVLTGNVIEELTNPIEISDPLTGEKTLFTYDYIKQINQELKKLSPELAREIIDKLKLEIREAIIERYKRILDILT